MNISSMSILKTSPSILKNFSTSIISKPIINFIMHKNNLCSCKNLTNITTFVNTLFWIKLLSSPMGNNFLLCSIMLCMFITIWIGYCSCMITSFIMIALNIKSKMTIYISCFIIRRLKVSSMLNITQVWQHCIFAQTQY
jgi:hypothetical protein